MSTHNICFPGEIRKLLCGYPLLSVAMKTAYAVPDRHMTKGSFSHEWAITKTKTYLCCAPGIIEGILLSVECLPSSTRT